jgi:hypothetical protein
MNASQSSLPPVHGSGTFRGDGNDKEEPSMESGAVNEFIQILEAHRLTCDMGTFHTHIFRRSSLFFVVVTRHAHARTRHAKAHSHTLSHSHAFTCCPDGKYVEAELATKRLHELRLHDESRKREVVRARQVADRLAVEEAHMREFEKFNCKYSCAFI